MQKVPVPDNTLKLWKTAGDYKFVNLPKGPKGQSFSVSLPDLVYENRVMKLILRLIPLGPVAFTSFYIHVFAIFDHVDDVDFTIRAFIFTSS